MAVTVSGRGAGSTVVVTTPLGSHSITPSAGGVYSDTLPTGITDGLTGSDDISAASRGKTVTRSFPALANYVLHIIGQSNAQGTVPGPAPYTLQTAMRNADGTPYVIPGNEPYGVDAVLAQEWVSSNSVTVIKTATGGVHIQWWIDTYWPQHSAAIDAATYPAGSEHIFLWIQGESNVADDYSGQYDYETKQRELFGLIRTKIPTAQIVDVKLNAADIYEGHVDETLRRTRSVALNAAKQTIADDLAYVDTIGGTTDYTFRVQTKIQHYDDAGYQAMAAEFLQVINS